MQATRRGLDAGAHGARIAARDEHTGTGHGLLRVAGLGMVDHMQGGEKPEQKRPRAVTAVPVGMGSAPGCERRKRQEIIDPGADGGGALPHEESTHDGLATMRPEVGATARTPPARPIGQGRGQHSAPAAWRPGDTSRAEPISAAATLLTSPSPVPRSAAGDRAGSGDEPRSEGVMRSVT